jgi:hypothetical protein
MKRALLPTILGALALVGLSASAAGIGPVLGGALPGPFPLFPSDNWWNTDVTSAPVDSGSASFINFIGATRGLHPDLGGDVSTGSVDTYGMPYCVVDSTQPKLTVQFQYFDESDGVDHTTQTSFPFYPIPAEAITQPHWVEGGDPGNVDDRSSQDRHILIVDRDNRYLYELYNVWYDTAHAQWFAGSGAFFDMSTNDRRPDGWTSADAAGLAILPGLLRYDEAFDPAVTDIDHAFRVTVRATNGYVYPASHRAGTTSGALPMGARLRLKASKDISGFTPEVQKIFRAMKRYGLIVADNGSDMFITGTYDNRWGNGSLNSAFGAITAADFEVVELGWQPTGPPPPLALSSVSVSPSSVVGGSSATGTATLNQAAPSGGVLVALGSDNAAASVPASVTIGQGVTSMSFPVTTTAVTSTQNVTISGSYGGVTKTAPLAVNPVPPPVLSSLTLSPNSVSAGASSTGTVTLSSNAPQGGVVVSLSSSKSSASVPPSVTVGAGSKTASFTVTTTSVRSNTSAVITATYSGVNKTATLTIKKH